MCTPTFVKSCRCAHLRYTTCATTFSSRWWGVTTAATNTTQLPQTDQLMTHGSVLTVALHTALSRLDGALGRRFGAVSQGVNQLQFLWCWFVGMHICVHQPVRPLQIRSQNRTMSLFSVSCLLWDILFLMCITVFLHQPKDTRIRSQI